MADDFIRREDVERAIIYPLVGHMSSCTVEIEKQNGIYSACV